MNKTIYLPVHAVSVSDSVECVRLINESFQYDEAPFFTDRATTVNSILFFAYMCQYITYEELGVFLGPYFTSPRIRMAVSSLVEKNLLRKEKFIPSEGLSRNAYCLTKAGISHILPMLPSHLTKNIKMRRSRKIVPLHDYYSGMNLLHFMAAGYAFTWEKELTIGGRLRPDIVLHMHEANMPSTIYIETDMGTENKATLLDKLSVYESLQLTEDSLIIFSMAVKRRTPGPHTGFTKKFLTELLQQMSIHSHCSIFSFYEFFLMEKCRGNFITDFPDFLKLFEEFLVWTGICRALNKPESRMSTKNLIKNGSNDMTINELRH